MPEISANQDVPQWVIDRIFDMCSLLGIDGGWYIKVVMNDRPAGSDDNNGAFNVDPAYLNSRLELARSLQDDPEGRRVILHEVGHLALADVDWVVGHLLERLFGDDQAQYRQMYIDAVERALQRMSRAMIQHFVELEPDKGSKQQRPDLRLLGGKESEDGK